MGICLSWLFYRVSGTILVHILADLRSCQLITSWKFALLLTKIVPWTVPLFCFLRMLQDEHDPSLQSSPVSWYVHFVLGGSDESIVSPENINYKLSTGCFWSLYWFIEIWTFTEFSKQYLVTICTKDDLHASVCALGWKQLCCSKESKLQWCYCPCSSVKL